MNVEAGKHLLKCKGVNEDLVEVMTDAEVEKANDLTGTEFHQYMTVVASNHADYMTGGVCR